MRSGLYSTALSCTRPALATLAVAALLFVSPLFTQTDDFEPAQVQPDGCREGQHQCGFNPTSEEQLATVPEVARQSLMTLPERVDLSANMPPVGDQGTQGSCVAWAVGYALKSYQERIEHRWAYDSPVLGGQGNRVFSPAYIYNQLNGGIDMGLMIDDALRLLVRRGVAPWKYMPYDPGNFRRQPLELAHAEAERYKAKRFSRIDGRNIPTIKALLAAGHALPFGMTFDMAFYNLRGGIYDRAGGRVLGGHSMTLVGYDDTRVSAGGHIGAFKVINSWGDGWGEDGFGWISYKMWTKLRPQTFIVYDDKDLAFEAPVADPNALAAPEQIVASRGVFENRVVVRWRPVAGPVGYELYRIQNDAMAGTDFALIGRSDLPRFSDEDVTPGVVYRYRVVAVSSGRSSVLDQSPEAEGFATQGGGASAPYGVIDLRASVRERDGRRVVNIEWSPADGATAYEVSRWNQEAREWIDVGRSDFPAYLDRQPPELDEYYYGVRAINGAGHGDWSAPLRVVLGGDEAPPVRPEGARASQGQFADRIVVEWEPAPGARRYLVFRYDVERRDWNGPIEVEQTRLIDSDGRLSGGAVFEYAILAANEAGRSERSELVSGFTRASASAPATPANVRVERGAVGTSLTWEAVPGAGAYLVMVRAPGDELDTLWATLSNTDTRLELADHERLRFYSVRAVSDTIASAPSLPVAFGSEQIQSPLNPYLRPGDSADLTRQRLGGDWHGLFWQENQPHELTVQMFFENAGFRAELFVDGLKQATVRGPALPDADFVEAGGFRLRNSVYEGVASIDILDSGLIGQSLRIGLERADSDSSGLF
ncbi:MAG: hypothetical protein H7A21_15240 [Spirochaetales bacterium]|nr:hypothetical protein [Leptospiraceae bacterium]MCP5482789.1 hypothetical protein [Spirochaetales bacterium]